MARTTIFVAVALAVPTLSAWVAVGSSPATDWISGGLNPAAAIGSFYSEADESAVDADETQWESPCEAGGGRCSTTVTPPHIASILAINQDHLAQIEPTLIISIHAPPTEDG
jgi:hypothetical protein